MCGGFQRAQLLERVAKAAHDVLYSPPNLGKAAQRRLRAALGELDAYELP